MADEITNVTPENPQETIQNPEQKPVEQPKEQPINPELEKLKAALTKASADAAEWKRQLREKQSEAERKEAERLEAEQAMQLELETLRKAKRVSDYTAMCTSLDFTPDLAAQTANAMADGDMDAVFACLKNFVAETQTRLNNEALNRQPGLSAGVPPTTNTINDDEMDEMRRYAGLPPRR